MGITQAKPLSTSNFLLGEYVLTPEKGCDEFPVLFIGRKHTWQMTPGDLWREI